MTAQEGGDVDESSLTDAEATGLGSGWEDLKRRAQANNLAKLPEIETAVEALVEGALQEAQRERAAFQAHKIAGSAGTFGLPVASERARELERLFAPPGPGPERAPEAQSLVALLRTELTTG